MWREWLVSKFVFLLALAYLWSMFSPFRKFHQRDVINPWTITRDSRGSFKWYRLYNGNWVSRHWIFLKLLFVSRALEAGKILDKKRYVAEISLFRCEVLVALWAEPSRASLCPGRLVKIFYRARAQTWEIVRAEQVEDWLESELVHEPTTNIYSCL